ncbi:hypothetical protein BC936DRAFT_136835 [Jimgerdemannia flammicorona]|uniref:Uncharacterized protein n=1 Tax=Jimgerdemannia flammicorona TaxID=994334 RepID=A0A433CYP7_9FUNG|nr:hypothetical protein BC936DRAFT_136835 [Jimgerdemannia flammicorona]
MRTPSPRRGVWTFMSSNIRMYGKSWIGGIGLLGLCGVYQCRLGNILAFVIRIFFFTPNVFHQSILYPVLALVLHRNDVKTVNVIAEAVSPWSPGLPFRPRIRSRAGQSAQGKTNGKGGEF